MLVHIHYWQHNQPERFIQCSSPVLIRIDGGKNTDVFIGGRCPSNSVGSYLEVEETKDEGRYNHYDLKFFCKEHTPNDNNTI